jgi:hypothetical protein
MYEDNIILVPKFSNQPIQMHAALRIRKHIARAHNFQLNHFSQTFPLFNVDCGKNRDVVLPDKDNNPVHETEHLCVLCSSLGCLSGGNSNNC